MDIKHQLEEAVTLRKTIQVGTLLPYFEMASVGLLLPRGDGTIPIDDILAALDAKIEVLRLLIQLIDPTARE